MAKSLSIKHFKFGHIYHGMLTIIGYVYVFGVLMNVFPKQMKIFFKLILHLKHISLVQRYVSAK